jgi:beta-glucanase (GH16 family)
VEPVASLQFAANAGGSPVTAVSWSVQESGGGTVNTSGLYTAPGQPGTFHVVVTSLAAPGVSATASVNVTSSSSTTIFFDDFSGSSLDTGAWVVLNRAGDYSNNEKECYSPSQVSVSGSNLVINSLAQTTTCGDANHSPSAFPVLSGYVQWKTFNFTYGTVEWRGTLGAGTGGQWPAVWLLGSNCQAENVITADNSGACSWPHAGSDEIDITEMLNTPTTIQQGTVSTSGVWHSHYQSVSDVSINLHTYQLVWAPGSLTWKVDGVSTYSYAGSDVPSTPMFLIINSAAGGNGTVVPSSYPKKSSIDYVKVTQP